MSLQVWLPLTKDLRNQGLADVTVTNIGATYNVSGGKLGGCYNFDGTNDRIQISNLSNPASFSVCFWMKRNASTGTRQFMFTAWDGVTCELQTNGALYCNTRGGGACYSPTAPPVGTWTHIIYTFQDKKEGKLYINGQLIQATATSNSAGWGTTTGNIGYYSTYFNGSINDFRFYDHCLSPMEVKRLSQGLVLHYPLNRNGFGQDNLMPNSTIMSVGSANASTGSWRVAGSSQMTRSRVAISDSPIGDVYGCQSVGLQTGQDASCWGIDGFPRENGTTYTISAWGRIVGGSSTAAMLGFSVYSGTTLDYGGTYGQAKSSDTKYYGSGAYDYAGGQLNPNGSWTRIYRTFTSTSTSDNIYVGFNTAKTGNSVTLQLCGVKLEKGDKVTSWCPKNTDDLADVVGLNENIEYDCSGFCNNGTRTGTFSWTSDTPKYNLSTKFNGSECILRDSPGADIYTLTCWAKTSKSKSTAQFMVADSNSKLSISFYNGNIISYFYGNSAGTGSKCILGTEYKENEWNFFAVVKTGENTRDCYCNGVKLTPTSNDWWSTATGFFVGNRSSGGNGPFYGEICDVRAYATALSADDVKNLYQNSEYIDNSNNVYAATYTEV